MNRIINGDEKKEFKNESDFQKELEFFASTWVKENHITQVSNLHDILFLKIWSTTEFIANPYESREELNSAMATPDAEYNAEAIAINQWYWATWKLIEEYAEQVTKENALTPEAFIATLPVFSFP